jgi:hypothetical protein
VADPVSIEFTDNGNIDLQASAKGITFSAQTPASVLVALAQNAPFPSTPVTVAGGELTASGDGDVVFDGGGGKVTFKGGADAGASLATFTDPAALTAALGTQPSGGGGLPDELTAELAASFGTPPLDDELLLALRWSYQISASAQGSMALGTAGNATFGFDGQTAGLFAVCRRIPAATGSRDAVEGLLGDWRLPRQVRSADDLAPGTWLVTEVDGSLAVSLGARLGYDFSWVRGVELGQLTGDVGLKIALGVAATVGLDVSGRYALVVGRESTDPAGRRLRVRLFKLAKRGWSFGFDLGAEVTPSTPQPSLDQLVQAVFGVQAAQLLSDLDRLSDPQTSLTELLAGKAEGYVKELLGEVTGLDVDTELAKANAQLEDVLARWNDLDHRVATEIWDRLEDVAAVREIRDLAQRIVAAPDLETLIAGELVKTGFFTTAGAAWLEALAPQGLLELVDQATAVENRVKQAAQKTLAVLDESTVESEVTKLKGFLAQRFGLNKVISALDKAIAATDPGALDAWLQQKLETFFDETLDKADPGLRQKLQDIQTAISTVRTKAGDIWSKTLQALNKTYSAKLSYTYQSSTSRQALFDVELDFAADAAAAGQVLGALLAGRFDTVLLSDSPAVTLHGGTLSFGLSRQGSVDITLPAFKKDLTSLTTAWGKVTAIEDDGRVLLYESEGDSQVDVATARARRTSRLSIAANLPVAARGGLRVHQPGSLRFSYSLDEAVSKLTPDQFLDQYRGYAALYFADQFPTDTGGPTSGAFAAWVRELDDATDADGWGSGMLGNTLASLQLALSAEVGAAWLAGVATGGDAAMRQMSLAIQRSLRKLVPFYWFQDPSRYGDQPSEPLLVYAAAPPFNAFTIGSGGVVKPKAKGDVYWDPMNPDQLDAMAFGSATTQELTASCLRISQVLEHLPGLGGLAAQYGNAAVRVRAIQQTVRPGATLRQNLFNLFEMEALVIHAAERAGNQLAAFQQTAGTDPEAAVEALTRVSADLAEAFNKKLWTV